MEERDKLKPCPFCGSEVTYMTMLTGIKMFYCKNHSGCGAIVSFDNPVCNDPRADWARTGAWNRRVNDEQK